MAADPDGEAKAKPVSAVPVKRRRRNRPNPARVKLLKIMKAFGFDVLSIRRQLGDRKVPFFELRVRPRGEE